MYRKYLTPPLRWSAYLFLAAVWLLQCSMAGASDSYPHEKPPVLQAGDLLPADVIRGAHHHIDAKVPTDGFLTWFTIHSDFGVFKAGSLHMARVRVAEVHALEQLETLSKSEIFVKGLKRSATEFGHEVKHLAQKPKETLQGVPEGVGRFFKRVYRDAKTGVQKLGDIKTEDPENGVIVSGPGSNLPGGIAKTTPSEETDVTQAAARMAGKTTADVFGYDDQRRKLAKQLRVDPYTTNRVLTEKLDEVAWVTFAGGLGFTALKSLAPASFATSIATGAADWVWDTPPGDLRVKNEKILLDLGIDTISVDRFLRHPWYTLTLQRRLTFALTQMSKTAGRADVLPIALSVRSYDQARFVVESLEMLASYHKTEAPVVLIQVKGTILGQTKPGMVIPVPADAVSWNKKLDRFARQPDFKTGSPLLWVRGTVTDRAKKELAALGWRVHENALRVPGQ